MRPSTVGTIISTAWLVLAGPFAFVASTGANADARGAVLAAWCIAVSCGAAAVAQFARGDNRKRAGRFLLVSGLLMPTFAAVALNLIPIVYGGYVALRPYGRSARRAVRPA